MISHELAGCTPYNQNHANDLIQLAGDHAWGMAMKSLYRWP